jgi:uncharacterized protein with PQ loop repeat
MTLCDKDVSVLDLLLGIVLVIGGVAAVAPQWVAIYKRRSSFGVSFTYVSLAWVSNLLTASNAGILKWPTLACCWREDNVPLGQCLSLQLPLMQIVLPFVWGFVTQYFYIRFCVPEKQKLSYGEAQRRRHRAKAVFLAALLLTLVIAVSSVVMYWEYALSAHTLDTWARVLGYCAGAFTCVQYIPQIVESFRLRKPGSLSVVSMFILGFGNVIVFAYQLFANGASVSTAFPNAVSALEVLGLLAMLLAFHVFDKRRHARTNLSLIQHAQLESEGLHTTTISPINNVE